MVSKKRKRAVSSPSPQLENDDSGVSPFLDLPLEIRHNVYHIFFQDTISRSTLGCGHGYHKLRNTLEQDSTTILYVSRRVHSEVWAIYTQYCEFHFGRPITMANEFLSFLPRQRLHSVLHLTLDNSCDWVRNNFLCDLERTWWYYLDVFSRLATLTFEATTEAGWAPRRTKLYSLVQPLIQLIEQGAPKTPRPIAGVGSRPLRKPSSLSLPESHSWKIYITACVLGLRSGCRVSDIIAYHRIVLQRAKEGIVGCPDHLSARARRHYHLIKSDLNPHQAAYHRAQACQISVISQAEKTYTLAANNWLSHSEFARFTLGTNTQLNNDLSDPAVTNGYYSAEVVEIAGQWTNHLTR